MIIITCFCQAWDTAYVTAAFAVYSFRLGKAVEKLSKLMRYCAALPAAGKSLVGCA